MIIKKAIKKFLEKYRFIILGIFLGILFWVLEAFIHFFIFHKRSFIDLLIYPDLHEIWMRIVILMMFVLFSAYAQIIIAKSIRAEEKITYMAYYDPVTNLPNRQLLKDRLSQALAYAKRNNQMMALLYLDLDGFKLVNDTLGHDIGDKLLKVVANRLKDNVRSLDTVARMGSDEFAILLANMKQPQNVIKVAKKLLGIFSDTFRVNGHEIFSSASIGISLFPSDGTDFSTLISNADIAMYKAKEVGRNNFQFYAQTMDKTAHDQLSIETNLHHALQNNELFLHYQPKVDLKTGKITGLEALSRWKCPHIEEIPTSEFIKIAEITGLIFPIGDWVLDNVCKQSRVWQNLGISNIPIAVNFSAYQFYKINFMMDIIKIMEQNKISANNLELELTESIIMKDFEYAVKILSDLKKLGVSVSIDDFGTGYSSLNYLKRFMIDKLKIDKSFIRDMTTDPNDAAIVKAIILMAHSLGLKVVAEGVETREQLDFLIGNDCDEMQGFHFSAPLPPGELEKLFKENRRLDLKKAA